MIDLLKEGIAWVTIDYGDGTKRIFRTTLNEGLLKEFGISKLEDNLYDINRKELVSLEGQISISKDKPKLDELNAFINSKL